MVNQLTPNLLFHVRIVEGVQAISYNKKTYSKPIWVYGSQFTQNVNQSGSIPHKQSSVNRVIWEWSPSYIWDVENSRVRISLTLLNLFIKFIHYKNTYSKQLSNSNKQ